MGIISKFGDSILQEITELQNSLLLFWFSVLVFEALKREPRPLTYWATVLALCYTAIGNLLLICISFQSKPFFFLIINIYMFTGNNVKNIEKYKNKVKSIYGPHFPVY